MMRGPIGRLARERIEARDSSRLPTAWVATEQAAAPPTALAWITRGAQATTPVGHDGVLLVMLRAEVQPAMDTIVAHANQGARVYLLVGPDWGRSAVDPEILQSPRVLLRRVPEVPATAIYTAGGGRLWLGRDWSMRLDEAQSMALRQTFLRLFWHDATEETWSGGPKLQWRAAGDRPFDVPVLLRSSPVRVVGADARLDENTPGGALHLAGGQPPEATPRRLWFPAGPDHHERLAKHVGAGAAVVWQDLGLPDVLVGGGSGEMLLPGERSRLRVRLTAPQASDMGRLLDSPARWVFRTDLPLGAPSLRSASLWLPGAPRARGVEAEQVLPVPDVVAPGLRGMPSVVPAQWPAPQALALAVRYVWGVVPPRLPAGTVDDTLAARWRTIDEDWAQRLGRVQEALEATEQDRSRMGRAFSRLLGAMLGFEKTHAALRAEVANAAGQRPSLAGPSGATTMLSRLAEFEEQARKLKSDMEDAERKARDDEERVRQETAWRGKVEAAKQEVPAREASLADALDREAALTKELASIEGALGAAEGAARNDLAVGKRRCSDELARAKKDIARLRSELNDSKGRAAEQFTFRPPASPLARQPQPGGRFVPQIPSSRAPHQVPEEALPEVGVLRAMKGQRYLVIKTWEDLDAGERAAGRLSAKLVAPENA